MNFVHIYTIQNLSKSPDTLNCILKKISGSTKNTKCAVQNVVYTSQFVKDKITDSYQNIRICIPIIKLF